MMAVSSDAGLSVASRTGSVCAASLWKGKKNGHWEWWSPGQSTWDTFGMRRRIAYVPEELRDGPKPGDRLLFIDGQPAPDGERGEEGDIWDHSKAYEMLEAAGLRHKVELQLLLTTY